MRSRSARSVPIPSTSSRKTQTRSINYSGGVKTAVANDDMGANQLLLAQNARMVRLGEYQTRHGVNLFSDAIGKSVALDLMGDNAENITITDGQMLKFAFTSAADFRLWQIDLALSKSANMIGTVTVAIYTSLNDTPSRRIAHSTIFSADIAADPTTASCKFIEAPDLAADTEYWLVISCQKGMSGEFYVGASEGGELWTSEGGELWTNYPNSVNLTLHSADPNGVDGLFVSKTGGAVTTFFGSGGKLYRSDVLGNVTLQNGEFPAGANGFQFDQTTDASANACVRYTYGSGKPRRISLDDYSETEITTATSNARGILLHGAGLDGYLFYLSSDDPNGVFTSEAVSQAPDSFDVEKTFVSEIPAPKCGDDLTAMSSLAGVLTFFTRRHKYAMLGESWQTFSVSDSANNHGTFSQNSVVNDGSYIYYASDTAIYQFNGTSEIDLTGNYKDPNIQRTWDEIADKSSVAMDIFDNRLYVFYSDTPDHINNKCLVYNLNLRVWESFDTDTYVSATCARRNPNVQFLQGLSRVGALVIAEDRTNNYDNLGAPIMWELAESYRPYDAPAQKKRISKWRPEFEMAAARYGVECGFAFDFDHEVRYAFTVDLANQAIRWDEGYLWDSGLLWPNPANLTKMTTKTTVYNEWRRCSLHYRHYAAHEPVHFIQHTLTLQTQRIR